MVLEPDAEVSCNFGENDLKIPVVRINKIEQPIQFMEAASKKKRRMLPLYCCMIVIFVINQVLICLCCEAAKPVKTMRLLVSWCHFFYVVFPNILYRSTWN